MNFLRIKFNFAKALIWGVAVLFITVLGTMHWWNSDFNVIRNVVFPSFFIGFLIGATRKPTEQSTSPKTKKIKKSPKLGEVIWSFAQVANQYSSGGLPEEMSIGEFLGYLLLFAVVMFSVVEYPVVKAWLHNL